MLQVRWAGSEPTGVGKEKNTVVANTLFQLLWFGRKWRSPLFIFMVRCHILQCIQPTSKGIFWTSTTVTWDIYFAKVRCTFPRSRCHITGWSLHGAFDSARGRENRTPYGDTHTHKRKAWETSQEPCARHKKTNQRVYSHKMTLPYVKNILRTKECS